MRLQWLAGIVALLVLAGNVAAALPRGRELLTNIPKPLSNVDVAYTFPNFAQESQIIVGEDVTTVITVRNDGTSPVNVKYITGSINSAKAYSIFLHNFTTTAYGSTIPTDGEQSFEYKFATAANMPPRQFRLALTVFYEGDKSQQYAKTFFNSTVEVMEPDRLIDTDALFLYLTLASIAAAIGYVVYSALKERTWFKEVSKKAIKQSGASKEKVVDKNVVDRSDYLVGTPHDLLQKKKTTKKAK